MAVRMTSLPWPGLDLESKPQVEIDYIVVARFRARHHNQRKNSLRCHSFGRTLASEVLVELACVGRAAA